MDLIIQKLTAERIDDYLRFFDKIAFADHPEWGCECFCCFFHAGSKAEWHERTAAENRELAAKMILAGELRGLLAYVDGVPAGWIHYDCKAALPGLKVFYPEVFSPEDSDKTGAIVCFTIAQGQRGQGIASRLLAAACQDLGDLGFDVAEAYPGRSAKSAEEHYHGPLNMYLAQGFQIIRESGEQWVVQKNLRPEIPANFHGIDRSRSSNVLS
jgi:GNAT superfamily N-acetyltransferase